MTTSTDGPGATVDSGWTRFAPAPTGYLHLGHVANAIWVWGLAAITGSHVLLRIEDHDPERSRAVYEAAILEDLDWLGFVPDAGPVRQADTSVPYEQAVEFLRTKAPVYACDCTRSTYAAWSARHGRAWFGPGCPGGCRERGLASEDQLTLRVSLGAGSEAWSDLILGPCSGDPSAAGDQPLRDRHGNWTYGFAVVVDDLRQSVSLVVRGADLADATAAQIRMGGLLGRADPPRFAHHPIIRKPGGLKLSKADGATGIRELRAAGQRSADVIGAAATAVGLLNSSAPMTASDVRELIVAWLNRAGSPA